jgi:formamidopyrimidine-DNA glycosylase
MIGAMPELPEVETIVRQHRPRLEGRRITRYVCRWTKQAEPGVAAVRRGIVGKRIRRLWRRAKYIVADLEHGPAYLLIHLRMSGRFEWAAGPGRSGRRHVRAAFDLDDGSRLLFCDARKFGKVIYTSDLQAATAHLGVEPLDDDFTAPAFEQRLRGCSRQLKPLLLDQSIVAGLGNIYVDEALFRVGLHPLTRSDELARAQIRRLRNGIRTVLRMAIRHQGTSLDAVYPSGGMKRHLKVYGRTGLPCRRCGTPIEILRVAQRGTHVCPACQPLNGCR